MSSDWPIVKWGDLVELRYGKSLKNYKDGDGNIPVYGTNGPIGFTDKALCDYPSVIVGRKGAYRGIHFSDKPFFVIDTAFYVEPKADINLKWAYYQLLTQDINGMDSGSAIPSTSREDFYQLETELPPIEEQERIVDILDSLNNKVELNRQINQTLEQIAQAIFKSWFVDFEPVKAKISAKKKWLAINEKIKCSSPTCYADQFEDNDPPEPGLDETMTRAAMRAISGNTDEELDHLKNLPSPFGRGARGEGASKTLYEQLTTTAELFPDELEDSELGEIPKGYKVEEIGEFINFANGKSIKPGGEGEYPIYGANGKIGQTNESKFENAIIIGRVGAYCGAVEYCRNKFWASDNTIVASSQKDQASTPYLFFLLKNLELNKYAGGAAQPLLNQSVLKKISIVSSTDAILKKYNEIIGSSLDIIDNNIFQNETLGITRDSLLPKLLSGEIQSGIMQQEMEVASNG